MSGNERPDGVPRGAAEAGHTGTEYTEGAYTRGQWLWDHSGRLAGVTLAGIAFAFMVFLAAIGFRPALFLVVLLVVGVLVIAVGGRIRA